MKNIKENLFKINFRLVGVFSVLLASLASYIFFPSLIENIYLSVIPVIIFFVIYILIEEKIIINRYYNRVNNLNFVQYLSLTKDFALVSLMIIVALFGIISMKLTHNVVIHIFLGVILISSFAGIEIRRTIHSYLHSLYTKEYTKNVFHKLILLIAISTLSIILLYNTGYIWYLLVGLTIGVIFESIKLLVYYSYNRRYTEASEDFFLLNVFPLIEQNYELTNLSHLYINRRYKTCIKGLEKYLLDNKNNTDLLINAYHLYTMACIKNKWYGLAEEGIESLSKIKSHFDLIPLLQYKLKLATNEYDKAIEILEEGLEKYKESAILRINYSYHLISQNSYENTRKVLIPMIKENLLEHPMLTSVALNNLAYSDTRSVLLKTGFFGILKNNQKRERKFRYDLESYKTLLQASLYANMAQTLNSNFKKHELDEEYHKIVDCRKIHYNDTLGYIDFAMGNFNSALEIFSNNLLKDPRNSWNRFHLAELNGVIGNKRAATMNRRVLISETAKKDKQFNKYLNNLNIIVDSADRKVQFSIRKNQITNYLQN